MLQTGGENDITITNILVPITSLLIHISGLLLLFRRLIRHFEGFYGVVIVSLGDFISQIVSLK
jgi:hypothetical protein